MNKYNDGMLLDAIGKRGRFDNIGLILNFNFI